VIKILYLSRDESRWVFRGPHYFQQQLAKAATVHFVRQSGSIRTILRQIPFRPDIIMLHMQPLTKALEISGLEEIAIPKAIYIEDVHYRPQELVNFVLTNDIHAVFCPYREHFHNYLHQIADRFEWLPHSVNPDVFRDWGLPKEIDLLLMGQVVPMYYPVRQAMLERFRNRKGFVFHGHPGYADIADDDPRYYVGVRYAQEINRSKIFLTCGSRWRLPLAKYFEAPACRSLLLAPGGPDLAALGFRDGETYVQCTQDDFEEKALELLKDPGTRERITQRGHEMVMERHTTRVRVREFLAAVERYV